MAACTLRPSRNNASRLLLEIAGGSIVTVSAGLVYGLAIASSGTAQYEGRIQIRLDGDFAIDDVSSVNQGQPRESTHAGADVSSSVASRSVASRSVASGGAPENFRPEYSDIEIQATFLASPEVIKPVLAQLRDRDIYLSYHEFTEHFVLRPTDRQTLEAVYRGKDAEAVTQVLDAIAQTYVQQGHDCQVQVCQNFDFVQMQLEQATQHFNQLQAKLAQFEQQYGLNDPSSQHLTSQHLTAEDRFNVLHRQLRLTQERRQEALQQLRQTQQLMGLSPDSKEALEIIGRSPSYRTLVEEWQAVDQRWIEAKFSSAGTRSAGTSSARINLETSSVEDQAQNISTEEIQQLEEQYKQLRERLNSNVEQLVETLGLTRMPDDLRDAVVEQPQRLSMLKPWLLQVQQVYLLQTRQQNLTNMAQRLQPQMQQWQAVKAQHQTLRQDVDYATEALRRFRHQYAVLYPQVMPRQSVWQLVSSPEVAPTGGSVASRVIQWIQSTAPRSAPLGIEG
ncbi:MAG: hypothetical protein WBA57_18660 [Elainellaceae cyanobacterium]